MTDPTGDALKAYSTPAPVTDSLGDIEARSILWNCAINACAALIEKNIIMDTSAGKVLAPRQDGNRDGLYYATAIRGLAAAEGKKATQQSEPIADDSLQAQIGCIGNQIHNLGCYHHNDEELSERLGELASSLWALAASAQDRRAEFRIVRAQCLYSQDQGTPEHQCPPSSCYYHQHGQIDTPCKTPSPQSNVEGPQTLEEAWELFDSRRFLHGHRETQRESFMVALRGSLPSALAAEGRE